MAYVKAGTRSLQSCCLNINIKGLIAQVLQDFGIYVLISRTELGSVSVFSPKRFHFCPLFLKITQLWIAFFLHMRAGQDCWRLRLQSMIAELVSPVVA